MIDRVIAVEFPVREVQRHDIAELQQFPRRPVGHEIRNERDLLSVGQRVIDGGLQQVGHLPGIDCLRIPYLLPGNGYKRVYLGADQREMLVPADADTALGEAQPPLGEVGRGKYIVPRAPWRGQCLAGQGLEII